MWQCAPSVTKLVLSRLVNNGKLSRQPRKGSCLELADSDSQLKNVMPISVELILQHFSPYVVHDAHLAAANVIPPNSADQIREWTIKTFTETKVSTANDSDSESMTMI